MKYKTVLFDFDGTLMDTSRGILYCAKRTIEDMGFRLPDDGTLRKFIGPPLSQSFERFYGFSPEDARAAVEAYRVYFSDKGIFENTVFEGIEALLKTLKSQNKVLALATSKPEVYALRILEHFHLAEYFDLVCGSLLGGERTDKGEVIAWAMHRMTAEQGIEHPEASAVMVGDREHDMIGAKRNHIPAIGVLFGYGSREELSEAGAWELAETVDDLYLHLTGEVYQGGAL